MPSDLYVGEITAIIDTKLDVRDGTAWSQFDKAINRLEGGPDGGGAVEASENAPSSPLPQPPLVDDSDEFFQMSSAEPAQPGIVIFRPTCMTGWVCASGVQTCEFISSSTKVSQGRNQPQNLESCINCQVHHKLMTLSWRLFSV